MNKKDKINNKFNIETKGLKWIINILELDIVLYIIISLSLIIFTILNILNTEISINTINTIIAGLFGLIIISIIILTPLFIINSLLKTIYGIVYNIQEQSKILYNINSNIRYLKDNNKN